MDSIPLEVVYKNMYSEYPEILEVKDLCEILGYGKKKVYQLIKEGQLKKIPCGRTIKVAKATIIDFVLQCAQKSLVEMSLVSNFVEVVGKRLQMTLYRATI